ncbi:MAG: hypothetical protein AABW50_02405 [Nanoarchaeota archaeon]|mgnify:FL=1
MIKKEKILIKPEDIKPSTKDFEVMGTLNPGAARLPDGNIVLYVRVIEKLKNNQDKKYFFSPRCIGKTHCKLQIDKFLKTRTIENTDLDFVFGDETKRLTYISHLRKVILDKNGFDIITIDKKPSFSGVENDAELGVEDARITQIGKKYYMTYVGLSRKENISTYLAESEDCINWKRHGIIFGEQDKDVVLFPEKIQGKYLAFDRPEGNFEFSSPHIWVAYSKDLDYWGDLKALELSNSKNKLVRTGAGPPPIKTDKGWLFIFHGVTMFEEKSLMCSIKKALGIKTEKQYSYAVWAALLDLKDPKKILGMTHNPILTPNKKKHVSSEGKIVLFPTGIIEDKEHLLLYSGAGDTYTTVHKIKISDIMKNIKPVY